MRTAQQRSTAYNARSQSSQLDPVRSAVAPLMAANYLAYANEFVPKQESLRQILNDAGISALLYFKYEACNGEFYHAWRSFAGTSLVSEFDTLVAKYVALGCALPLLTLVAEQIWNVTITPPGP